MKIVDEDNILDDEQKGILKWLDVPIQGLEKFNHLIIQFPGIETGHTATLCKGPDEEWAWFVEN